MSLAQARRGLGPKYYQRYLVRSSLNARPIGSISALTLLTGDADEKLSDNLTPLITVAADTPLDVALQKLHNEAAEIAVVEENKNLIGVL